jgi:F-type H+-transporting ATPase subunit delta
MTDVGVHPISDRASTYARALLDVARAENAVERVEDELFRFARVMESNDELRSTLTDAMIPVDRRLGIVEDLLGKRAHTLTTAMVTFVIGAGRGRELPAIADAFVEGAALLRQEVVAEVRAAVPLDADQQARLAAALSRATGKRVSVKVIVDPEVLGGIVARIGDTVIDGSVRGRLEQLKETL